MKRFLICLVMALAACSNAPVTPIEILEDEDGPYTVSARQVLVGDEMDVQRLDSTSLETQSLNSPRVVLEIRNYNSATWGRRSRAALKITWYSELPLTGTASIGLQEAPNGDTIVRWSQQSVSIQVAPGRSSRTITFYSSYHYKPDARLCAETAFYLQSGELGDEESLYIDYGQKTCELVVQQVPQDDVVASGDFVVSNEGDTLTLELHKNTAGEYRGIMKSRARVGNWAITSDGNLMGIREQDSSSFRRSNPFTLGFEGEGAAETVTRYAPGLESPVCFDVTVNVRGNLEQFSVCEGDTPTAVEQVYSTNYFINGVEIIYTVERALTGEGLRLVTDFVVPAGETVWEDQFDYGNFVVLEGLPGSYPANQVFASLEQDLVGPTATATVTPWMEDLGYTDFCFYLEGVMSVGALDFGDYVYDERCTFDELQPEPGDDNATVILEELVVEQEGQRLFVYKIEQHNVFTEYFRTNVETVFSGFELSPRPDFQVTGYADGNLSTANAVQFVPGSIETPWIRSNEPGEEVCYLLQANWNAYDLEDWGGQLSGSFRHSDCVQMDDVTSPPIRATTKAVVTSLNQGNIGLKPLRRWGRGWCAV